MIDYNTYMTLVASLQRMHPAWRKGQTVFNAATLLGFKPVSGSVIDCFYNDNNIEAFIDDLVKLGLVLR